MGMFNWISVADGLLPDGKTQADFDVEDAWDSGTFQTKDIEPNLMDEYRITPELQLQRLCYDLEQDGMTSFPWAPEKLHPKMKRINDHWDDASWNGDVCFYTSIGSTWHEYVAHFENGKLSGIRKEPERELGQ